MFISAEFSRGFYKVLKNKLLLSLTVSIFITACNASNTSSDLNMTFEQAEELRSQAEAAPSNSDEKKKYYKRLETIYENLAKEGNSDAQLILADIYFKAMSGTYDAEKSFEWTKKSADNGNISAMYNTGFKYYTGVGVQKNIENAKKYYLKAAKLNDVDAMGSIGSVYIEEGNTEEGLIYLKRAAEKNDALSLFELGLIYCDGVVVKKDYKLCNDYWGKSALLNNAEAALNLGINVMNGKGVPKDVDRAIKYFEIASELSKGQASYNLGVIYSSPNYNKLNESLSQFYFNKAYEQGISNAKEKIKQ
ncbi:hypothetical protein GCM10025882_22250 [Acinetobacter gyllenbergii]|uniref:tetratricopeptide repeat protein n=1 Tax=Acinetobacter gyllenbergii TaxID=134534 RepID=UPI0003546B43|nr:tetratricopeptide repeat protein [Acinetobacter gyllenbergii]EPH31209.1 Sel1 domain protein repeat-containing protein [Acinetobacter gyllenbergii CIP 110306 = MTCC 11365]GMA11800.1 hypothetical protein GCM10025882_22250 [Acinetobacter gyllenbergii]